MLQNVKISSSVWQHVLYKFTKHSIHYSRRHHKVMNLSVTHRKVRTQLSLCGTLVYSTVCVYVLFFVLEEDGKSSVLTLCSLAVLWPRTSTDQLAVLQLHYIREVSTKHTKRGQASSICRPSRYLNSPKAGLEHFAQVKCPGCLQH